jgi:hypothetical protein
MKHIMKCISLLLFSGLIILEYNYPLSVDTGCSLKSKTAIHKSKRQPIKISQGQLFIYQQFAETFVPELAN